MTEMHKAPSTSQSPSGCCPPPHPQTPCCGSSAPPEAPAWKRRDWLLWGSLGVIVLAWALSFVVGHEAWRGAGHFSHAVRDMLAVMWWGILIGMIAVGVIDRIPREFVIGVLGRGQGARGIARALLAGVFLDLCNHGVLMVGAKLYERGASLGQTFAFLVASPWNSLSLTIIIGALMGWGWMLVFLLGSLVVAFLTGLTVEGLEKAGRVRANPNRIDLPEDFHPGQAARDGLRRQSWDLAMAQDIARRSVTASRMVLRWLFFGIVLAALIQTFVPDDVFASWFGPTVLGLLATLVAATVIEVCSEGSVPIAADLMARAQAPGNAFTFLMAGAATDYTEIMILREVTGRLRAALLLPLLTVPQVIAVSWVLNAAGG